MDGGGGASELQATAVESSGPRGLSRLHVVSRHQAEGQPVCRVRPNPPPPSPWRREAVEAAGPREHRPQAPVAGAEPGEQGGPGYFYTDPVPRQRPFLGWAAALCWKHLRGERAAGGLSNHHFLYVSECGRSGSPPGQGKAGRLLAWEAGTAPVRFQGSCGQTQVRHPFPPLRRNGRTCGFTTALRSRRALGSNPTRSTH